MPLGKNVRESLGHIRPEDHLRALWRCLSGRRLDFGFLVDMFVRLNELNTKLQGKGQLISNLYRHIGEFEAKLNLRSR